jgi:glc operon protein GlcG
MANGSPTLAAAQSVLAAAVEEAARLQLRVAVVVVDRGGHDVAVARMDGVSYINVEVARRKARASSSFSVPTHAMTDMLGRDALLASAIAATNDQLLVLPGGFPMTELVTPVGGFGIAGGHYEQDQLVGEHVVRTLAANL